MTQPATTTTTLRFPGDERSIEGPGSPITVYFDTGVDAQPGSVRRADHERVHGLAGPGRRGPVADPAGHHPLASLETLAALDPFIEVSPDDRFMDNGDIVSSAGVSAGIDTALHLVARLAGEERAREVPRYIEYDPAPRV